MNILVIGNGFDIAHHLPTQYSDFLDFVKSFKEPNGGAYTLFLEDLKMNKSELYLEIKALIENNVLIEYFISIYLNRSGDGKRGWVDFEREISTIVRNLDEAKIYIENKINVPGDHVTLEEGLFQYLRPIIVANGDAKTGSSSYTFQPRFFDYQADRVLDALNRLTRLLEIFLFEYVEKKDCTYRIADIPFLDIDSVLSFNYTDTYKKLYDPAGKNRYCFIHGKTRDGNMDSCNLVLGIDEYLPPNRIDDDNQFIWFKKFYQRIYKQTGSEYLDWIKSFINYNEKYGNATPSKANIFIYGHSLDVTDKDILSKLILLDNATTYIYYHDRDSFSRLISNLVKVIGEENLIKKTGGTDRTIIFKQSMPAILQK